jgi:hypothetical protein
MIVRPNSDDRKQHEVNCMITTTIDNRQQLRLQSLAMKSIDRTQLHRSQSIQYNQYRSIGICSIAPSAFDTQVDPEHPVHPILLSALSAFDSNSSLS